MTRTLLKPLLVVEFLDLAAAFLDGERVGGVARLEVDLLLAASCVHTALVADDLDVLQDGPLDHLEDDQPAAGNLLRERLDA